MNTFKLFDAAVKEAFSTNAANPAVCYSPSKGWFVESLIHPADDDCVCRIAANYNASTGRYSVGDRSAPKCRKSWESICETFEIAA